MNELRGKTILITGGTGSFGHQLVKNAVASECAEIRIFSRDELKQELMRNQINHPHVKFYIGDVRNRASVDKAMRGVDLVFHAAALKQVPSCEFFPMEAVSTNIVGSYNVIESAIDSEVKHIVCLSTDKAVYPINAMGMTKALMEKVCHAAARSTGSSGTVVSCVRYGNVLYSRGSVIPLFVEQIRAGGPITITEPSMTRFLLPLEDAIDLVLFAFSKAKTGDVFVKKAPACTVADLAAALCKIFHADVEIKQIGTRHGEKVFETLITAEELGAADDMGDYFRLRMDARDLNYSDYLSKGDPRQTSLSDYTSHNTQRLSVEQVQRLLESIPEIARESEALRAARR